MHYSSVFAHIFEIKVSIFYSHPDLITTLTFWWGGLCVPMTSKAMLAGALSPGRVSHARQVER